MKCEYLGGCSISHCSVESTATRDIITDWHEAAEAAKASQPPDYFVTDDGHFAGELSPVANSTPSLTNFQVQLKLAAHHGSLKQM